MSLLAQYLMSFVGTEYHFGGDDPLKGFDCSGLAMEMLIAFGFKIPDMNAHNLYVWCQAQGFKPHKQLGALSFYGKRDAITHVGIVLNEHLMIEAGGGDSTVTSTEIAAAKNAFIRIRPILYRRDYVDIFYPIFPVKTQLI